MSRTPIVCAGSQIVAIVGLLGCNAILGIEKPYSSSENTAQAKCVLTSDCPNQSEVCIFGVCSPECKSGRDCETDEWCLLQSSATAQAACVTAQQATCANESDCPNGTSCIDAQCRNRCVDDDDCLSQQTCSGGKCITLVLADGGSTSLDPTGALECGDLDAAGAADCSSSTTTDDVTNEVAPTSTNDAMVSTTSKPVVLNPTSGVPEQDSGAESNRTWSLTAESTSVGDYDAASTTTTPEASEEPTSESTDETETSSETSSDAGGCTDGEFRCVDNASVLREVCDEGQWQTGESCLDGALCDTDNAVSGTCRTIVEACRGREPGESFCVGETRTQCGIDLVTIEEVECESEAYCEFGTALECAACLPNEARCDDDELSVCNATFTAFSFITTCDEGQCNAQAASCAPCTPDQRRCQGSTIFRCSDDQSNFDVVDEDCGDFSCNPQTLRCQVCQPNASSCEVLSSGPDELVSCSSDGSSLMTVTCDSETPHCSGQSCVECLTQADCGTAPQCYNAVCSGATGECGTVPSVPRTGCGNGDLCDGQGECVECLNATDCTAENDCYTATCEDGQCGQSPRGSGIDCGGGNVCDGNGNCVECVSPTNCDATNSCYTAICQSGQCIETPDEPGESCAFAGGRFCDGDGACVACTQDDQCQATNACFTGDCTSNNTCTQSPRDAGDACAFDGGRVCDGLGNCVECVEHDSCSNDEYCSSTHVCLDNTPFDIGRTSTAGGTPSAVTPDLLWATRIEVTEDVILQSIGMIGAAGSGLARLAVYTHDAANNAPGTFLSWTSDIAAGIGRTSGTAIQAGNVPLAAGSYWVAGTWATSDGDVSVYSYSASGARSVRITDYNYSSIPPTTFPDNWVAFDGTAFALFITVIRDTQ